jgi:hypothetical protein
MVFLLPKTFELIGFFQSFDYGRTHVQWKRNQFLLNTKYIYVLLLFVLHEHRLIWKFIPLDINWLIWEGFSKNDNNKKIKNV